MIKLEKKERKHELQSHCHDVYDKRTNTLKAKLKIHLKPKYQQV